MIINTLIVCVAAYLAFAVYLWIDDKNNLTRQLKANQKPAYTGGRGSV